MNKKQNQNQTTMLSVCRSWKWKCGLVDLNLQVVKLPLAQEWDGLPLAKQSVHICVHGAIKAAI